MPPSPAAIPKVACPATPTSCPSRASTFELPPNELVGGDSSDDAGDDDLPSDLADIEAQQKAAMKQNGPPTAEAPNQGGDNSEADAELKMFAEGASEGFDLRCPLGWRFSRECGKDPAYCKLGRFQKAAFRKQWADAKQEELLEQQIYTEKHSKVDISKGTYRSLLWVLKNEGGSKSKSAQRSTLAFAKKCHQLGEPWVVNNPMFDRLDYLVMQSGFKEEFGTAWTMQKTGTVNGTSGGSAASSSAALTPNASGKPQGEPPASGKPQGSNKGGKKEPLPSPRTNDKKETTLLAKANKTKSLFMSSTSMALQLFRNVENSKEWNWAVGCKVLDCTKEAMTEIEELLKSNSMANSFFTDPKYNELKKRMPELEEYIPVIPATFDEPIARLSKLVSKMLNMHRSATSG